MKVDTPDSGKIMFHGNQRAITLSTWCGDMYTYNVFDAAQLQMGNIPLSLGSGSYTYWAHEDTLQFAISLNAVIRHVIIIKELQPTSTPPLHILSSFPIPPQDGEFSFSPVLFHASFVTRDKVIVLDIQNLKLLFQAQVVWKEYPLPKGQFCANGYFFACGTSEDKICVWQNTPTGYLPWRTIRPRLPFGELLFSPTAALISCYGIAGSGIQLLQLGNHPDTLYPIEISPYHKYQRHLVAYSADWVHIAMAKHGGSIVTVLNCSSGNPQQLTNPDMEAQDIKIVNNTLFVVDRCKVICWDLEAGGTEDSVHGAMRVAIETLPIGPDTRDLTLSHDCSKIAFTRDQTVFLHDLQTPGPIAKYISPNTVLDLQFSPDQCQLWLLTDNVDEVTSHHGGSKMYVAHHLVKLGMMEGGGFGDVVSEFLETTRLWADLSSHGCSIVIGSSWVEDPRGSKLLWLPPNWRPLYRKDIKWNGNYLALIHNHQPEPVIIQFHL